MCRRANCAQRVQLLRWVLALRCPRRCGLGDRSRLERTALESARRNFALNAADRRVAAARHETVQADAFDWLAHGPRHAFDLVVVDPPSLAKRESERARALEAYARLNAAAVARLRRGGMLVTASCSSQISSAEFFGTVFRAAGDAGRHP